ncbi:aconitase X [Nocardioides sp. LHG3406-4]|uniref:aconitase X n=1 Tax=Nocardioides sp. LHG3406-4 TaxID=2804575 RepID=UPI003CFA2406
MLSALDDPVLDDEERAMLEGEHGQGVALAMRVVVGLARVLGARRLVAVESVHVDGCLFHGMAGVDFVQRLNDLGASVRVPTTLNVGSLDLLHPELVNADQELRDLAGRLMAGYVSLGATPTWTCAPYQLPDRPSAGTHIAWAESNAIVFANSVLGARTDRYGDFLDICAGVTGRAPYAGLHLDENRAAGIVFDFSELPAETLGSDAVWGALGYIVGMRSGGLVPAVVGLAAVPDEDDLKSFGAAAASSGGVGLFHVVGVTPEAPTIEDVVPRSRARPGTVVTMAELRSARDRLTSADGTRLDAVSIGTPHLSLAEFRTLADTIEAVGRVHPDVEFWVNTGRGTLAEAERLGIAQTCRDAGVRVLVDTCTYVTSVLKFTSRAVMTNSAKWAWYAPSNLGVQVVFGSLEDCVRSAHAGRVTRDATIWGDS